MLLSKLPVRGAVGSCDACRSGCCGFGRFRRSGGCRCFRFGSGCRSILHYRLCAALPFRDVRPRAALSPAERCSSAISLSSSLSRARALRSFSLRRALSDDPSLRSLPTSWSVSLRCASSCRCDSDMRATATLRSRRRCRGRGDGARANRLRGLCALSGCVATGRSVAGSVLSAMRG